MNQNNKNNYCNNKNKNFINKLYYNNNQIEQSRFNKNVNKAMKMNQLNVNLADARNSNVLSFTVIVSKWESNVDLYVNAEIVAIMIKIKKNLIK